MEGVVQKVAEEGAEVQVIEGKGWGDGDSADGLHARLPGLRELFRQQGVQGTAPGGREAGEGHTAAVEGLRVVPGLLIVPVLKQAREDKKVTAQVVTEGGAAPGRLQLTGLSPQKVPEQGLPDGKPA